MLEDDIVSLPRKSLQRVHDRNRELDAMLVSVRDGLDTIRRSGFVSYNGEKPHVIAAKLLEDLK